MNTSIIGQTIHDQINALDFWARARWGVKQMLLLEDGLQLNLSRGGRRILMHLAPSDTYTIQLYKFNAKTFDCPMLAEMENVYAESLVEVIESLLK